MNIKKNKALAHLLRPFSYLAVLAVSVASGSAEAQAAPPAASQPAVTSTGPTLESYPPTADTTKPVAAPAILQDAGSGLDFKPPAKPGRPQDEAPWPGFQREPTTSASATSVLPTSESLYYMTITSRPLPAIPLHQQQAYAHAITRAATETHLQPALIRAVITAESGYNANSISPKGAIGLMQVLPSTARRFGVRNPLNPAENIKAGSRYLAFLLRTFNNNLKPALAAYNAGEQAVIKYGNQIPPYRETIHYVPRVLQFYAHYQQHAAKTMF